jgi:phosphatidylglycerol:prolipoprotein diacylglycerol transferase
VLRELFRIPILDLPVFGYGLMLVLGVWTAVELARYLANRFELKGDDFVTLGIIAMVSGVVGARISHVLENLDVYTSDQRSAWDNFIAAINISSGGLTFYGGFIVATAFAIAFGKLKKIPIRRGMDIVAPCLMLGLAFGRVGCLLNGCCWGQTCEPQQVAWSITFPYDSPPYDYHVDEGLVQVPDELVQLVPGQEPGELIRRPMSTDTLREQPEAIQDLAAAQQSLPVHPTQLYSVLNALLIMGLCLAFLAMLPAPGKVFALMLLCYGPGRFALEMLRVNTRLAGDLTYSMWVSIGVTTCGLLLYIVFGRLAARETRSSRLSAS